MSRLTEQPAVCTYRERVQRSQWLRDLSAALDRAERLAGDLAEDPDAAADAAAICVRIGEVRATLALIRFGRADEIDPNWLVNARSMTPLLGDPHTP